MTPHAAMTSTADDRDRLCEAIAELQRRDRTPAVRLALAEAEFRLAVAPGTQPAEAVMRLERAITHDPFLPKLYLHLGRLLHRSGKHSAALSAYRHAVSLAPSSRRAHLLMALALLELGKPEQELGQDLLDALVRGATEQLRILVAELDTLVEAQNSPDPRKSEPGNKRPGAKPRRNSPSEPMVGAKANAPKDIWRVALTEQLSRAKPVRKQVTTHLETGSGHARNANSVAEYAAMCALMAALGEPPAQVRRLATAAGADAETGHPAFTMLEAILDLADTVDPAKFVAAAAEHIRHGLVPPEPVVWLHFSKFAEKAEHSALESIRLLESYPEGVRQLDCFRELRIAVLDEHAHRAWARERFAEAKLLWQEAAALDPLRVPIALNLALLAARTRSVVDYGPAWERLAEVLYLNAAGAEDVQLLLEERKALHLALSQQSEHRYCPQPPGPDKPGNEELSRWLADADALAVWLREWDLYYLHARLHFRSPLHLLGQPKDASDEALAEARDALLRHIDSALLTRRWAGVAVFGELARAQVQEAFRLAVEPVNRARDPYFELEKAQAETLAGEMLQRVLLLRKLIQTLIRRESGGGITIGCSIARRQFTLSRTALQRHCVDKGVIGPADNLFEILETDLIVLAQHWDQPEPTAVDHKSMLAAFDECVQTVPHRLELRALRCRVLVEANCPQEAYTAALEALKVPATPGQDEIRTMLVDLIDHVGYLGVPESLRQPKTEAGAEKTIAACKDALLKFPRSATLRRMLAQLLVQLGGKERTNEAIEVLTAGIEPALSDEQRRELEKELGSIRAVAATEAARKRVRDLAQPAMDRVKEAVNGLREAADRQAVRAALEVVQQAKADLSQAISAAGAAGLTEEKQNLEEALSQLRALERQLEGSEG